MRDLPAFGRLVHEHMDRMGLSREDMAKAIGMPHSHLGLILKGQHQPARADVSRMINVLDLQVVSELATLHKLAGTWLMGAEPLPFEPPATARGEVDIPGVPLAGMRMHMPHGEDGHDPESCPECLAGILGWVTIDLPVTGSEYLVGRTIKVQALGDAVVGVDTETLEVFALEGQWIEDLDDEDDEDGE